MEEKRFECRFCFRKFLCGKSLGGHIRTHMMSENEERRTMNANAAAAMFKFDDGRKRKRSELGSRSVGGDDGNYIYGLRENPKKTTRFVHSNAAAVAATVQMEKFCKECGKGFPSLKALCGHMASHSEKEKVISQIEGASVSGARLSNQKEKLVADSQSDTEDSVPTDPRKAKRMKLKIISSEKRPSSSSPPWGNCSSSISEVDQDHEEVARTLMMLSTDKTFKGRFAFVTESSDNNSVVAEPIAKLKLKLKSPETNGKSTVRAEMIVINGRLLKNYGEGYDSDNSDSGYFLHGPKNEESDASSNWCSRNHEIESSKKIMSFSIGRTRNCEEFKGTNWVENSNRKNIQNGDGTDEMYSSLKNERESYSDDSVYESDENSTDSDSYTTLKAQTNKNNMNGTKTSNKKSSCKGKKKMKSKKNKEHGCPLCERSFKSGQALGGHKRSHFVGGHDESTFVIRPAAAQAQAPAQAPAPALAPAPAAVNPCLIDLNLPAPDDE